MRNKQENPRRICRLILIVGIMITGLAIGTKAANGQATPSPHVNVDTHLTQSSVDAAALETPVETIPNPSTGITLEDLLITGLLTLLVGFLVYNLFTSGKNGWGWFVLMVVAGVAAFFGRLSVSIFQELAGSHGPSDWDES